MSRRHLRDSQFSGRRKGARHPSKARKRFSYPFTSEHFAWTVQSRYALGNCDFVGFAGLIIMYPNVVDHHFIDALRAVSKDRSLLRLKRSADGVARHLRYVMPLDCCRMSGKNERCEKRSYPSQDVSPFLPIERELGHAWAAGKPIMPNLPGCKLLCAGRVQSIPRHIVSWMKGGAQCLR
jgi:hypothetical protein